MKPRRWYSSPELNPDSRPCPDRATPPTIYWCFTTRVRAVHNQVVRQQPVSATGNRSTPAPLSRPFRRIEAA